ncbi:hypothetical protein KP509_05G066800 [Ceratopteris richardii]|uniref:Uncharacterized protein n=1 Tax=Ceratopteris richardii TaxID=49495 RepID=A0A8T2UPM9_CERRI|nr:hypothetical protein KP509_05G066800 [Ceratopteris richardii]
MVQCNLFQNVYMLSGGSTYLGLPELIFSPLQFVYTRKQWKCGWTCCANQECSMNWRVMMLTDRTGTNTSGVTDEISEFFSGCGMPWAWSRYCRSQNTNGREAFPRYCRQKSPLQIIVGNELPI